MIYQRLTIEEQCPVCGYKAQVMVNVPDPATVENIRGQTSTKLRFMGWGPVGDSRGPWACRSCRGFMDKAEATI